MLYQEITQAIELHPLSPLLPSRAKVLILGSFPPAKKRWKMAFYYPNWQNDMWRILGLVFFQDKDYFLNVKEKTFYKQKIIDFLNHTGIAISDVALKIKRNKGTAADQDLAIIELFNFAEILRQLPECEAVITTGEKATKYFLNVINSKQTLKLGESLQFTYQNRDLMLCRAPSSSRAYPLRLEKKAETYQQLFQLFFKI